MRLILFLVLIVALIAGMLYYADQRSQLESGLKTAIAGGAQHAAAPAESTANMNPNLGRQILRGHVTDANGAPVARARVLCERRALDNADPFAPSLGGARWTAETGADGAFAFTTLPEGGFAVLAMSGALAGAATASTRIGGAIAETIITLAPVAAFAGKAVLGNGKPAESAGIAPVPCGPGEDGAFQYFPARANTLGQFTFSYLPARAACFLVKARGVAPVLLEGAEPGKKDISVVLNEGISLSGEVIEEGTDKYLPQVRVKIVEESFGIERYSLFSDANGEYTQDQLRPAAYLVSIDPDRYVLSGEPVRVFCGEGAAPQKVTLRAARTGGVRGRVLDATGRKGMHGLTVIALGDRAQVSATTDTAGYYAIKALPAGAYRVAIDATAGLGQALELPAVDVAPGVTAQGPELRAPATAPVSGRVLDSADHPADGANVFLSFDGSETAHLAVHTGADGAFAFPAVDQAADVRVWARKMGQVSVAFGPVRVGTAGIKDLNFALNMTARAAIRGVVRRADGAPAAGVTVQCLSSDTSLTRPYESVTGPDGGFTFTGLRAGTYRLQGDPAAEAHRVDLEDGQQLGGLELLKP
jgi:hypothetical protein